jgi:hypothetical protein
VAAFTEQQYQARFELVKAELFEQQPFLAQHFKIGSQTGERMVRSRLVRQLDHEPMDLLIVDNDIGILVARLATQNLPQ